MTRDKEVPFHWVDSVKTSPFLEYTSATVASDFPCASCTYPSRLCSQSYRELPPPVSSPYGPQWQVGWNERQEQGVWKWKQVNLLKWEEQDGLVWQIRSDTWETVGTLVWKCMSTRGDGLLRLRWDFKRGECWSALPVFHLLRAVIWYKYKLYKSYF